MATLTPGQSLTTPGRTIGAGDINLFAGLVGDFTPIHVDEVFAKSSPFGTRIAHGPLAMATAIGMLTQTGVLGERVIGLLNLNWDFCGPVKIDDTIRSRVTLEEQRPTSKAGRELTTFVFRGHQSERSGGAARPHAGSGARRRSDIWKRGSLTMGDFVMRPDDEMTHKPDASVNFNESVYTNGFNSASPVGGWMRLGNRVNEGYAELSVCLYLPDGRIACQFQRPNITSNERFDAGGLSYSVIEQLKKVSMTFDGELMIVKDPNALRDPKTLFADGPRLPGHVHWTLEAEIAGARRRAGQRCGADHVWPRFFARSFQPAFSRAWRNPGRE